MESLEGVVTNISIVLSAGESFLAEEVTDLAKSLAKTIPSVVKKFQEGFGVKLGEPVLFLGLNKCYIPYY